MNKVKIGDLLTRIKESIDIEEDKRYKRVTIKTNNQGVYLRDIETGSNIGTKKQFIIHAGQFLLSKIDARNGAFGIVPVDLDGAIITGNFWTYEVNHELLNIEWFNLFVSSPEFIDICDKASSGTTNRRYLDENRFLNFVISLPSIDEQSDFMEYFKSIKQKYDSITIELNYQHDLFTRLRQSILQEAVQGKLVPQDPNDEPASVLLKRIKEEKERLIKEKKIKKEKPLPPIIEDEVPYELPGGWEWCRLQEAIDVRDGTHDTPKYVETGGYPLVTGKDFYSGKLEFSQTKYISKEDYGKIILRSKVDKGDILFSMIGGNIGSMVIIKEDIEIAIKNVALFKRYYEDTVDNKYLFYFLKANIDNIKTLSKGGAQPFVSLNILRNYLFPLPPLNEQKRIVEKVDQLMALCDELEKDIKQSKNDSELLMQSVLQEAFKKA